MVGVDETRRHFGVSSRQAVYQRLRRGTLLGWKEAGWLAFPTSSSAPGVGPTRPSPTHGGSSGPLGWRPRPWSRGPGVLGPSWTPRPPSTGCGDTGAGRGCSTRLGTRQDRWRTEPSRHGSLVVPDLFPPAGPCRVPHPLEGPGPVVVQLRRLVALRPRRAPRHLFRVPRTLRLADVKSPRAPGFGVTARVNAGSDYARDAQPWTRRFAAADFDGASYGLSHEPALRLRGLAGFGEVGEHPDFGPADDHPIPETLVAKAMVRFGVRCAP